MITRSSCMYSLGVVLATTTWAHQLEAESDVVYSGRRRADNEVKIPVTLGTSMPDILMPLHQ